jgi:transcriptional regulator with XRE-family HTH domain
MLRHLMEAKVVTQAQLSRDTTIPKSTISKILAGKKHLSRQLIRKFADYFRVDASVLVANFLHRKGADNSPAPFVLASSYTAAVVYKGAIVSPEQSRNGRPRRSRSSVAGSTPSAP